MKNLNEKALTWAGERNQKRMAHPPTGALEFIDELAAAFRAGAHDALLFAVEECTPDIGDPRIKDFEGFVKSRQEHFWKKYQERV